MMRKLLILVFIMTLITRWVFSRTINISARCNLESDHTKLGRCLRPWLDLWEMIRVQEGHASNLVYPIPFYSRESVLFLCSAYLDSRSTCMTSEVLEKCKHNEMIIFIQSHMRYYCGNKAKLAFEKFGCIHDALMSDQHCWRHIQDISSSTYGGGKCIGIPTFFNCILPGVRSKCENSGVHILVDAITSFGCALQKELVRQSAAYIAKMNDTGEFTEEAGKTYIRNQLPSALPVLDEERNARPSIQRYMTMWNNFDNFHLSTSTSSTTNGMQNESSGVELFHQRNPTNGLLSSFLSKKQTSDYRLASDRKIDSDLDDVEENTFLQSDPAIEIAFDDDENVISISKTKLFTCTTRQEEQIAQCYAPMIELWNKIQNQHRSFDDILLPFLTYDPKELNDLCDLLDVIFDNCFTTSLISNCQNNILMEFVNEHFGIICSKTGAGNLSEPFTCLRKVIIEKKECTAIIRYNSSGIIHCDQMSHFFDCLLGAVQRKCTQETQFFFADIITNFGCTATLNHYKSNIERTTTEKMSMNQKRKSVPLEVQKINPSIVQERHSVKILDGELFSYQLSTECTKEMQIRARLCVKPLMLRWNKMRQQRPMLKNVSFPMYKYTRQELLELCDGYANMFLCAGFESITICLNDEMIRFARDHFGYICTPQNIKRFMEHYECIVEVATAYNERCQMFITGVAEPGKDLKKCRGIRQYYDCMKSEIIWKCHSEALKEFETSVIEYGCDLGLNDSL
uniref:DUF19 domain-containing protein n=2 Tax=Wuchereria bancrofti TaxID=6293 RepID=A0AAF5PU50_WUCBA